jgi:hypothetical protein
VLQKRKSAPSDSDQIRIIVKRRQGTENQGRGEAIFIPPSMVPEPHFRAESALPGLPSLYASQRRGRTQKV